MNKLDTILNGVVLSTLRKLKDNPAGVNTAEITPKAKQAIEAYIAERERLARIDELNQVKLAHGYTVDDRFNSGWGKVIDDRLDHLSKGDNHNE